MPRHHLLSTPTGLRSLLKQQPRTAVHGDFGFVSTELAFVDAMAAHALLARLEELYHAAASVHAKVRVVRGQRAAQDLAALAATLDRVRAWM